jgi:hypothetical protein
MSPSRNKNFAAPDASIEFEKVRVEHVRVGDLVVGKITSEPGRQWSKHI